ncbi:MAG: phosphoribosylglycinamide formyltransferase [Fimbriimonadia bacterium]|nr:phosphoribosylglycinamide formyltransferase [Fimbriimonadia bacterium]
MSSAPVRIAILVSGKSRGSTMEAIIRACQQGRIEGQVACVIGVRPDSPALEKAETLGVRAFALNPKSFPEDDAYGSALMETLIGAEIDLICLAGYMRLLPLPIVRHFKGRIMNIHPALLPLFGGRGMYGEHVHRAVIESGMKVAGCTVHFVDEAYDTGPIILQTTIPIEPNDTPEALAARLLPVEHETYIRAVQLFAEGKLRMEGHQVRVE